MTKKLYYIDSYVKTFEASVLKCEESKKGYEIVLDQTAFYPEGGGQPSDLGEIDGIKVNHVAIKDEIIYHYTEGPLEVGSKIKGEINFERRFDFMQQHSGEHIVSGIINRLYGYNNVGFHLTDDTMTADVDGELDESQIQEVERLANQAIFENIEVQATIYPNEIVKEMAYRSKLDLKGDVRIVDVKAYDTCACCGTHVRHTGEIGSIKIIGNDRHRGGMRLTLVCGKRALLDYGQKQKIVSGAMGLLSAKPERILEHIQKLQEEMANAKLKLAEVNTQLFALKAAQYKNSTEEVICIVADDVLSADLRRFCTTFVEETQKKCLVLIPDGTGYKYAIGAAKGEDIRGLCKALNAEFDGKGGGQAELCQGSLQGDEEAIRAFIKNS